MKVGAGWNIYTAPSDTWVAQKTSPSDYSLVARDGAGRLWWYGQQVPETPGTRTLVGAGWNIYTMLL